MFQTIIKTTVLAMEYLANQGLALELAPFIIFANHSTAQFIAAHCSA
jgi:hypothetical protein